MRSTYVFHALTGAGLLALGACNSGLTVEDDPNATRWTGNDSSCPESAPAGILPCDAAEGELCAYRAPDALNPGYEEYTVYGCWMASGGQKFWYPYDGSSGPPCPSAQPASGSNCDGMRSQDCHYPPRISCTCASSGAAIWSCASQGLPPTTNGPTGLDPATPITALTPAQRTAWCHWYAEAAIGPGFPEPTENITEDGFTNGGCYFGSEPYCFGAMAILSSASCSANLALSTCNAPIGELSDCARTFEDSCWPSPHGCARYLDRTDCAGTIITGNPNGAGGTSGGGGTGGTGGGLACPVRVR